MSYRALCVMLLAAGCAPATESNLVTLEDGAVVDLDELPDVLEGLPGRVGLQLEDGDRLRKAARKLGDTEGDDVSLRPSDAEVEAVLALVDFMRDQPHDVHICGISTAGALNALEPHRGDIPVTVGISPQHLFLSIETHKLDEAIKNEPPIRHELDRRALWSAVKRGRIDAFHSAHVPLARAAKSGRYPDIPPGMPGVDTLLALLIGAVKNGRLGLEQVVQMCGEAPARLFGLTQKGRIEVGADADLLLVREGQTRRLKPAPTAAGGDASRCASACCAAATRAASAVVAPPGHAGKAPKPQNRQLAATPPALHPRPPRCVGAAGSEQLAS